MSIDLLLIAAYLSAQKFIQRDSPLQKGGLIAGKMKIKYLSCHQAVEWLLVSNCCETDRPIFSFGLLSRKNRREHEHPIVHHSVEIQVRLRERTVEGLSDFRFGKFCAFPALHFLL